MSGCRLLLKEEVGAETLGSVSPHLWQMSGLGILLHLVNVGKFWKGCILECFFFFFSSTWGHILMLKLYQHTCRIPCGKKRHQIGLGRLISVEMLQVQVSLLGKYKVVLHSGALLACSSCFSDYSCRLTWRNRSLELQNTTGPSAE